MIRSISLPWSLTLHFVGLKIILWYLTNFNNAMTWGKFRCLEMLEFDLTFINFLMKDTFYVERYQIWIPYNHIRIRFKEKMTYVGNYMNFDTSKERQHPTWTKIKQVLCCLHTWFTHDWFSRISISIFSQLGNVWYFKLLVRKSSSYSLNTPGR